jgi:glycosyltransferase involved in cell wall biosynthesis
MRIGIYDPYLDDMGGGEKYMLTLASCLSSENDVTLFWNKKEDVERVNERFGMDLSRVNVAANIFSHSVSFFKRAVETRKYDALIVLSDGSIPAVLSKKLFLHIQQPIPGVASFKTKLKLKRVNKIFCNSYFSKNFVDRQLGVESVVVYPPVELHPKKAEKENMILHVGRFRAANIGAGDYKKQGEMMKAFKKIYKEIPGWKFVIAVGVNAGQEAEFDDFREKAKGAPIEFMVNKTNEELWNLYSKAKIYWHASGYGENLEEHPEYAEHFGISTVEAMGAGCVPVVINAGGQKEIVEDNISGFLWNDLSGLTEKTLILAHEDKILESMSREAKKRARDFTGDRFCTEIKNLIK